MLQIIATVFLSVLALIGLFWFIIPCKYRSRRDRELLAKLPGPKGYPILGNGHLVNVSNEDFYPLIRRLTSEYKPFCRLAIFNHYHVLITDIKDIEKILSSRNLITKSYDYTMLEPWLRTGLLTSTGSKWHARRKILTSAFHFKILEDYIPIFNRNSDVLISKLRTHINVPYVSINNFITLCTLDIICESAMGTKINSQEGHAVEYVKAVQRISELFQKRQLSYWLYRDLVFMFTPTGREQSKVLNTLHSFTAKVIRERRAEYRANKEADPETNHSRKRLAFLDLLIEVSENEQQLTDIEIQEEVDTFMFEGHDTTSAALSWALHLLGAHPDIQEKVVQELNEIFGDSDRPATYEDLQQMKYLERVIKETLRLYPSVPAVSRHIDKEIELSGYTIPADTNLPILAVITHRNPELWPDPERFDPDRFLPENAVGRHPFAYIPFSAGPRNCIGQRFALLEEKVVLSSILRNFQLHSLDDNTTIKPLLELIMRPKEPLRIQLSARKCPMEQNEKLHCDNGLIRLSQLDEVLSEKLT